MNSFDQEVLEAQRFLEKGQPIAPAQVDQEIQPEPTSTITNEISQEADLLDPFDRQVQEAQKVLDAPQSKKEFDSWFDDTYAKTKGFLEATGESIVHLGYGAVSFLPSYGMGFATMVNQKLKNILRQDRIDETVRMEGFPVSPQATDLARKPMAQRLEEAKIKTPEEIRELTNKSSMFLSNIMGEPVTKGGKATMQLADIFFSDLLLHYPKQVDEKLTKAGYPNLGYLTGFAGEMLFLKMIHSAAKEGKTGFSTVASRYKKVLEDVSKIETPKQLKTVSNQVDKILDQLGVTEEQRMIATDKTFREQKDVGSWIEERSRIRKEASSAKEVREETKAPGKEEKLIEGEAERLHLRDVEKGRMEAKPEEKIKIESIPSKSPNTFKVVARDTDGNTIGECEVSIYKGVAYTEGLETKVRKQRQGVMTAIHDYILDSGLAKKLDTFPEVSTGEGLAFFEKYRKLKEKDSRILSREESAIEGKLEDIDVAAIRHKLKMETLETPFVQKPNIVTKYGKRVAGDISDGVKVAEDMGVFETIRAGVEGKKKVGEIIKEIKEGRYYREDLKDFGYNEKDLRNAIRAIKVQEFGDVKLAEGIKTRLEKEIKKKAVDIGYHGTSSKFLPGIKKKGLQPVSMYDTVEMVLNNLKLKGKEREQVRQKIYNYDYFEGAVKGKEDHRPFKTGEVYVTKYKSEALEYAEWAGEVYDNALIAAGAFDKSGGKFNLALTEGIAKKAKKLYEESRAAEPVVLKVETPTKLKRGDNIFTQELKYEILGKKSERVDVEHGRPPGAKAKVVKVKEPSVKEELMARKIRAEAEEAPLRTADGKILKSQALAKRMAKSRELVGDVVRTPDGKGWYVKKTKEMRKAEVEATKKLWDNILKEEGLGEIKADKGAWEILTDERGSVIIQPETIKKLQDKVRKNKIPKEDIIKGLERRGVPESQILRIFPNVYKETPVVGTSEFLKKYQDPESRMPRRVVKKKTGRMKYSRLAPAVTRGDAHVVSTFSKDLKRPIFSETYRISTSEGTFTQLGKPMKEVFLYPMRAADKSSVQFATKLIKESNVLKQTFKLGTRQKHADRIGMYSIAKQEGGLGRLKLQGIKEVQIPKKLTSKEQVVYDYQENVYKNLFVEINLARRAAGEQLFPPVKNYSPWFHDLTHAMKLYNITPLDTVSKISNSIKQIQNIPSRIDRIGRTPGMKGREKFRAGPETPGYLHLNAFDNFTTYVKIASNAIHKGPTTAYLHELLRTKFKLPQNAPNTWNFLNEWLSYQKGKEPIGMITNPTTRRWLREGSSNVAISYITYVWSSMLNQVSSIPNSAMFIGVPRMIEGLAKTVIPEQFKRATRTSDILLSRSPEAALMKGGRAYPIFKGEIGRSISDFWGLTAEVGSKGLTVVDNIVAHATWLGAEAQGKRIYKSSQTYKEMPRVKQAKALEDFSKHYADDIVSEAQGSASRTERAPIQRTAEGAAATTLQTFVIANFDLLRRQMLGIGHPDLPKKVIAQRIMRQIVGLTATAYAFDFLGMRSPNPRPINAALETLEEEKYATDMVKYKKMAITAAKELVEYIPLIGGKLKYSSEIGGPVLSELIKLTEGDLTALLRLGGMRGLNQVLKSYRAEKRGGTAVDIIFGRYVEKRKMSQRSQRSGR